MEQYQIQGENQQVSSFELGWLCGVIESEGNFSIYKWTRRKTINYQPWMGIMNTDKMMIEKANELLKRLKIAYYIGKPRKLPKRKFCYQIRISGYKRIKRLLDLIGNLLITKRDRAIILKKFVEKRLNLKKQNGCWNNTHFDQEDESLFQQLRKLNQRGDPRDHQEDSSKEDEGMVRAV